MCTGGRFWLPTAAKPLPPGHAWAVLSFSCSERGCGSSLFLISTVPLSVPVPATASTAPRPRVRAGKICTASVVTPVLITPIGHFFFRIVYLKGKNAIKTQLARPVMLRSVCTPFPQPFPTARLYWNPFPYALVNCCAVPWSCCCFTPWRCWCFSDRSLC